MLVPKNTVVPNVNNPNLRLWPLSPKTTMNKKLNPIRPKNRPLVRAILNGAAIGANAAKFKSSEIVVASSIASSERRKLEAN